MAHENSRPARGRFKTLYVAIWDDLKFSKGLSPEEKLLLLHLRTTKRCNRSCVFPFYAEEASDKTGMSVRKIRTTIENLQSKLWIVWERPYVWVKKGLLHDPFFAWDNPKHVQGIRNELNELPQTMKIVKEFWKLYEGNIKKS